MLVLRPVRLADLDALVELAGSIRDGLTSLPADPAHLEAKIHASLRSFYPAIAKPGPEQYFFVVEDTRTGAIVGTSGIVARVGGFDPFWSYAIVREPVKHAPLGIDDTIEVLHLRESHKGPSELCSLYLSPEARRGGNGRLASLGRFLFVRAFPERFDATFIAELRGWLDADGVSPFWEAVARAFFRRAFRQADFLSGLGDKDFIAALMPRHPIYVPLLPAAAQAVIGRVHPETEAAKRLLEREGFGSTNEVDIFDAGPLVAAQRGSIRTVRDARPSALAPPGVVPEGSPRWLVAQPSLDFRAILTPGALTPDGSLVLSPEAHEALRLGPGSNVLACDA